MPEGRARRGHTQAVCPTCDGERQQSEERRKDSPCAGCLSLLRRAEQIVELHKRFRADQARQSIPRHPRVRNLYIHGPIDRATGRPVKQALERLAEATGVDGGEAQEPTTSLVGYDNGYIPKPTWSRTLLYSDEQIAAFTQLVETIEAGLRDAYVRGHEDGADLFRRLKNGDTSVFDYEGERAEIKAYGPPDQNKPR